MTTTTLAEEDLPGLADLIDRVEKGESILLTRDGRAVGEIRPLSSRRAGDADPSEVVRRMLELRDRHHPPLGDDLTLKELIEEGRR